VEWGLNMSRDVEFDEDAICDGCGRKGAFDFLGDFYCADCLADMFAPLEEEAG